MLAAEKARVGGMVSAKGGGGRQSENQWGTLGQGAQGWLGMFNSASPTVDKATIEFFERAGYVDFQISAGRKFIKHIGATKPQIMVSGRSASDVERINRRINELDRRINGGLGGLTYKFFDQMLTTGALSREDLFDARFSQVMDVALVPVQSIEFRWTKEKWTPFQTRSRGEAICLDGPGYLYLPVETVQNSPYGIPPFLAAGLSLMYRSRADENIKFLLDFFGNWGMTVYQMSMPDGYDWMDPEQTDKLNSAVTQRATDLSQNHYKSLKVMPDDGKFTHVDPTDAKGADALYKDLKQGVNTGIMPGIGSMTGQDQLPVQTFATVLYRFLNEVTASFQEASAWAMRETISNDLMAGGISADGVEITYPRLPAFDPLAEAQAWTTKFTGWLKAAQSGSITPDELAQEFFGHAAEDPDLINAAPNSNAFLADGTPPLTPPAGGGGRS